MCPGALHFSASATNKTLFFFFWLHRWTVCSFIVKKRKIKEVATRRGGEPKHNTQTLYLKFETQMMKPSLYVILDLIIWAAAVCRHGMPSPPQHRASHMYSGPSVYMILGHYAEHYSRPIHHLRTGTWEQGFTLMIQFFKNLPVAVLWYLGLTSFFYIFLWMITTLAMNKNSVKYATQFNFIFFTFVPNFTQKKGWGSPMCASFLHHHRCSQRCIGFAILAIIALPILVAVLSSVLLASMSYCFCHYLLPGIPLLVTYTKLRRHRSRPKFDSCNTFSGLALLCQIINIFWNFCFGITVFLFRNFCFGITVFLFRNFCFGITVFLFRNFCFGITVFYFEISVLALQFLFRNFCFGITVFYFEISVVAIQFFFWNFCCGITVFVLKFLLWHDSFFFWNFCCGITVFILKLLFWHYNLFFWNFQYIMIKYNMIKNVLTRHFYSRID